MKKALVHDWFYVNGGAEKVVKGINQLYPSIDNFGLIDFLNASDREDILQGKKAGVSFIQKLPTSKRNHRKFLQLFPYAVEQFDLSSYDLVLTSSASVAKGVLTHSEQLHLCYCHSPMRYAWDLYYQYLRESSLTKGLKSIYARYVLHKMRLWDVASANRVDFFLANSKYIANRIQKIYGRESTVVYPPVATNDFVLQKEKEDFYFTSSRMVPYKKIDLVVRAFNRMPNKQLVVAGDGPDFEKIKRIAKDNIILKGFLDKESLVEHMKNAKAFVFAAKEDFGIIPVEAQACGTPVIGYGIGGLGETVIDGQTGVLFYEQNEKELVDAVEKFESIQFDAEAVRQNALRFDEAIFKKELTTFVDQKIDGFKSK